MIPEMFAAGCIGDTHGLGQMRTVPCRWRIRSTTPVSFWLLAPVPIVCGISGRHRHGRRFRQENWKGARSRFATNFAWCAATSWLRLLAGLYCRIRSGCKQSRSGRKRVVFAVSPVAGGRVYGHPSTGWLVILSSAQTVYSSGYDCSPYLEPEVYQCHARHNGTYERVSRVFAKSLERLFLSVRGYRRFSGCFRTDTNIAF